MAKLNLLNISLSHINLVNWNCVNGVYSVDMRTISHNFHMKFELTDNETCEIYFNKLKWYKLYLDGELIVDNIRNISSFNPSNIFWLIDKPIDAFRKAFYKCDVCGEIHSIKDSFEYNGRTNTYGSINRFIYYRGLAVCKYCRYADEHCSIKELGGC